MGSGNSKRNIENEYRELFLTKNKYYVLLRRGVERISFQESDLIAFMEKHYDCLGSLVTLTEIERGKERTCLYYGIVRCYTDVVKRLLEYGVNPNVCSTSSREHPLFLAIDTCNTEMIELIISYITDKKIITTCLNAENAKPVKSVEILKLLIKHGADVKYAIRMLPFHCQTSGEFVGNTDGEFPDFDEINLEYVKFIIDHNENPDASHYGRSLMYLCGRRNCNRYIKEAVTVLLNAGADPNFANEDRVTPLHMASKKGSYRIVELLIGAGANINAVDDNGNTPKDLAKGNGHHNVVRLLKQHINQHRSVKSVDDAPPVYGDCSSVSVSESESE